MKNISFRLKKIATGVLKLIDPNTKKKITDLSIRLLLNVIPFTTAYRQIVRHTSWCLSRTFMWAISLHWTLLRVQNLWYLATTKITLTKLLLYAIARLCMFGVIAQKCVWAYVLCASTIVLPWLISSCYRFQNVRIARITVAVIG